jgi:hypothetical protein
VRDAHGLFGEVRGRGSEDEAVKGCVFLVSRRQRFGGQTRAPMRTSLTVHARVFREVDS